MHFYRAFLLLCSTTQGSFHWNVIMVTELRQLICEYMTLDVHRVYLRYMDGLCLLSLHWGCDEKG